MWAGIVYTSKTTMISPQINNEKELSSRKKKKNTYSSQEIKGYFLIQFLLRENSDKLSTELEI